MTQEIQKEINLTPSLVDVSLQERSSKKKSDKAFAASFQKLQDILEVVDKDELSVKAAEKASSFNGMASVMDSVRETLLNNPSDIKSAIDLIAPYIQGAGKKVSDQLEKVTEALVGYQEAVSGLSDEKIRSDYTNYLAPMFSNTVKSGAALEGLLDEISPLLEKLNAKDPSKIQPFADKLMHTLGLIALRNPDEASTILGDFPSVLEKAYNLDDASQGGFFSSLNGNLQTLGTESDDPKVSGLLSRYSTSGTPNSPDMSKGSLGMAMLFLQMFQTSLSKCQADQGNIQAVKALAMINSAAAAQVEVGKEVEKAEAAAKAAASRPWWEKLVEVVVAVVGVVVAALTAGVGAALVAVAVGAFMASPAFNDAVQGLAAIIPGPFSEIIAKAIVLAMVMVVSCGLGGLTTAADATVDTSATAAADTGAMAAAGSSLDTAVDVTASTATDTVSESSASLSKFAKMAKWAKSLRYSKGLGLKMGLFQGVSGFTTSGIVMDIITTTSPHWAKEHAKAVLGLTITAEVLGVLASCLAGKLAFSGETGSTMLENLPKYFKGVIPASWGVQMGGASMETYLGVQRVGFLKTQADATRDIGQAEANLGEFLAAVEMMNDSTQINNNSASSIVKAVGEQMDSLSNNSANAWKMAAKVAAQ